MGSTKKYHNYEKLNFSQKATEEKVLNGKPLSEENIKDLCTGFLLNIIYAIMTGEDKEGREKSLEIAAKIIVENGEKIAEQLKKNDEDASLNSTQNSNNQESQSNQNQPNTSEDIKKISGGTMAHVINKISELMASMSPEERRSFAANVSAFFSVLGKSFDKMDQTMQNLAENPIVIANLKNCLEETDGKEILEKLTKEYSNPDQQDKISKVSEKDLKNYTDFAKDNLSSRNVCNSSFAYR